MTTHSRTKATSTIAAAFFAMLAMTAVSSAQSDATLSGLVPSAGTLDPAFASGTITYTASVPYATTDITVTPTATDPVNLPTITVNTIPVTSDSPSGPISLAVGANVITTVVLSQDMSMTTTYTLTVTRTAPNVDLSSLVPSAGTLIPAFASGTTSYNASVPTATTDITVTPTAVNPSATITVNGNAVTSGNPSGTIALSAGSNTITTVVTGEDAVTTKTYTLTVTRGPKTLFSSGTKAWNTTAANWGLVTGGPYNTAVWSNSDNGDSATFQGTAGTVTLGEAINLKTLSLTNLSTTNKYTIAGSTLAFSSGGSITTASTNASNFTDFAFITSAITGSPNVVNGFSGANNQLVFAPASGSVALGSIGGTGIARLAGSTTGNSLVGINGGASTNKLKVSSGTWTLTGTANGYEHFIEGGNLIISTGTLQHANRAINLIGGTLHMNNAAAIRATSTPSGGDSNLRLRGGSIDNTSGAAITTSTWNPGMNWEANWTFIGSNGADSNLYMGTGGVHLKDATRQVTVQNAATTLAFGGVFSNGALTKAGPGTLELRGASTYTGATTVNGGRLKLGANNVIPNASNVSIGSATLDADTRTDTAGTLDVTNANSVINLGTGAALAFANSSGVTSGVWAGSLNITGTFVAGNDVDPGLGVNPGSIRFGTNNTGLTASQLADISVNGSGAGTYTLDAFGYLKPSGGGPGPVDHFVISAISSPRTVGTPITGITITAEDSSNATATSFTGTVTFGGTGGFTGTSASFTDGVLSGVSVTPTVAGSNLTFTVDDGASHTGSTTITTIQTKYVAWAGSAAFAFDQDANDDSVDNGLAWVLGATDKDANALPLLPTTDNTTDPDFLIFTYRRDDDANTDPQTTIKVEYGSTLSGWTTAVPGVDIIITPTNDGAGVGIDLVEVKIRRTLEGNGKLFARLNVENTP